jgi:hypothetical protein
MSSLNTIFFLAASLVLFIFYCIANYTGYDALSFVFGLPVGFWIIWNLRPDQEKPSE